MKCHDLVTGYRVSWFGWRNLYALKSAANSKNVDRYFILSYFADNFTTTFCNATININYIAIIGWFGGVVVRLSDLRLAVVGSNPGHCTAGYF